MHGTDRHPERIAVGKIHIIHIAERLDVIFLLADPIMLLMIVNYD